MGIPVTDITLLWRNICVDDDMQSFDAVFHLLNTRLIRFCVFYTHNKEAAEDIVSEVFIKCWENRKCLLHVLNPENYLFAAVKNQSLNYIKKYSNIHLVQIEESGALEIVNTYDPQKELERKELHFLMDKAIDSLPPQAAIIFRLIKEDGMKYKDVAAILNISPRTVQTQLFRAIKKLAVLLMNHRGRRPESNKITGIVSGLPLIPALLILLKLFFQSL